jgi:DNA-binding MarR family transcriptional regulator
VARKSINPQRVVAGLLEQVGRFAHGDAFLKGLNPAQWTALGYFARANRVSRTVSVFALYHGTTRGTATQTVKALVQKGCLRRRPLREDRRSFRLELTAKGRKILAQDPLQELIKAAGALSSEQCSRVAEGLEIMLGRLLAKRGRPVFGVCGSCRHVREWGRHVDSRARSECGLRRESLIEEDLAKICVNYEPSELSQALAAF